MKKRSYFLSCCLFRVARFLLALRYDVKVVGLDNISKEKSILFLPNHPAEIDPILLMVYLGPKYFPRPMVVEHFYRLKGFQWILDLTGAIPIPTMEEKANIWRGKEVARIFQEVSERMRAGDSFLIYPAGKLKAGGGELIGGASFVHSLLQACPGIHVVLVRTTGLWGSSFSKAPTGRSPEFGKTLLLNLSRLIKNWFFFIPKRAVLIEIADAPADLPIQAPRLMFNKFLEEWYN
ncbi:MAG: 1-acyl-sn-glycerol-3-phosphate acyltransferase, partial [Chlamydiia bacterium]|nr:1-acyl-sn-glycerol-3-phosphate acyltransferase [Chlamydiia bacterium]